MSLITRTWVEGTSKQVRVLSSSSATLIVSDGVEGYVLVNHGVNPPPAPDTQGTILFQSGKWLWQVSAQPVLQRCSESVESEEDLHNNIIAYCRNRRWQYLHGSMAHSTFRTIGEPDFCILASAGRVFFVECKSKTGKLSPEQLAFKVQADMNGHTVHVVRSLIEFRALVEVPQEFPKSHNAKAE